MTQEYDTIVEAKRSVKAHISFFDTLLKHLKGSDIRWKNRALWTVWCIDRYFNDKLLGEVQEVLSKNTPLDNNLSV